MGIEYKCDDCGKTAPNNLLITSQWTVQGQIGGTIVRCPKCQAKKYIENPPECMKGLIAALKKHYSEQESTD